MTDVKKIDALFGTGIAFIFINVVILLILFAHVKLTGIKSDKMVFHFIIGLFSICSLIALIVGLIYLKQIDEEIGTNIIYAFVAFTSFLLVLTIIYLVRYEVKKTGKYIADDL